jgi:hypothetical protein
MEREKTVLCQGVVGSRCVHVCCTGSGACASCDAACGCAGAHASPALLPPQGQLRARDCGSCDGEGSSKEGVCKEEDEQSDFGERCSGGM